MATTENKWADYDVCSKCEAEAGQPCVNQRTGEPAKNAHPGRRKLKADDTAPEAPQDAPAGVSATPTPKRRRQQPAATSADEVTARHSLNVTPMSYGGLSTFKASCSCGDLAGSNWTRREDAEKEYERHLTKMLVSA